MDKEMMLTRELGQLQSKFNLTDTSDANRAIGERIREIRKELNLICKPRENRRQPRVKSR